MNRATLVVGVILAVWWLWPTSVERAPPPSGIEARGRPRIRVRRRRERPAQRSPLNAAVAEYASDLTCDLLEIDRRGRLAKSPTTGSDADVAAAVARMILRDYAPRTPRYLEEGLVRHVCTYFDGTWTNEAQLERDALRVDTSPFPNPIDLSDEVDPLYAMLFLDLLFYSDAPMLKGKLALLYRGYAREGVLLPELFDEQLLREVWEEHLERFARTRSTIRRAYR